MMHLPGRIRTHRWVDVARACEDEALTAPAIAVSLGTTQGGLRSVLSSMEEAGLLEQASSPRRGRAVKLTAAGKRELRKVDRSLGVPSLGEGERLLFVIDAGGGLDPHVLDAIAEDPEFGWAVLVDGSVGFVASFGQSDGVAAQRAVNLFVAGGSKAVVGRTGRVLDADGLHGWATRLRHGARPRRLTP